MRAFGALRDTLAVDLPVGLVLQGAAYDPIVDWSWQLSHVYDQGGTQACTGFALATCAELWATLNGLRMERPSELFLYWLGRGKERHQDIGARPRELSRLASRYGFVPSHLWPFDEGHVSPKSIAWALFTAGVDHKLSGFYRTTSLDECRLALFERHPITATFEVDQEFLDGNYEIGGPLGLSKGLHRVCLVGYRPGWFLMANSWGPTWGKDGLAWISDARVQAAYDLEIVTVVAV